MTKVWLNSFGEIVYTIYLILKRHNWRIKATKMASSQLWANSTGWADPGSPRATPRHFDRLKCLSCAAGELGRPLASLVMTWHVITVRWCVITLCQPCWHSFGSWCGVAALLLCCSVPWSLLVVNKCCGWWWPWVTVVMQCWCASWMMVVEEEEICGLLLMPNQALAFAETCLGRWMWEWHI